jgi:hypothetical protein
MSSGKKKHKSFGGYKSDGANWITLATGEYYPDVLTDGSVNLIWPTLML